MPTLAEETPMLHRCEPGLNQAGDLIFESHHAVGRCTEFEGKFWVGNDHFVTRVNYCPFCGAAAPNKVDWQPEEVKIKVQGVSAFKAAVLAGIKLCKRLEDLCEIADADAG